MSKAVLHPRSANWRIVIPNLQQYKDSTPEQLMQLRHLILQRLKRRPQDPRSNMKSEFDRGLRYYHIAIERHANGVPHLDILLIYDKSIQRQLVDYNFLLKQGHITTYRTLNNAILNYGKKQDTTALSNLPESKVLPSGQMVNQILELQKFKRDPYRYLELQMLKDPLHFNLEQYVRVHDLFKQISNWGGIKSKLKDSQLAAANLNLKAKPGFKPIDRKLIQAQLSQQELAIFDSWSGYQTIVNYLNQIVTMGYRRPLKTKNLLITGTPNTGKTSLFVADLTGNTNCVKKYCAVYPMGAKTWWPNYRPEVYPLLFWNEAKLTSYAYDTILKVLEGSEVDLPYKGGSTLKYDNPLVVMTSNLTLDQMILQKFPSNQSYQEMARKNLAVRVENIIVPEGHNLFLLQKLLCSA